MATIIDSLVVTLGLDGSGFAKGQKQAAESLGSTQKAAAAVSKQLQDVSKKLGEYFAKLRNEAVGLFAVFTAGRGIKDFIADLTSSSAAAERTAHNLGISIQTLSAWQEAAKRAGGSAEGITATFQRLSQALQNQYLTGSDPIVTALTQLGVPVAGLKTADQLVRRLSQSLFELDKTNPQRALAIANAAGLSEEDFNLLRQGPAAIDAMLAKVKQLGLPSEQFGLQSQRIISSLLDVKQGVESVARAVVEALDPTIETVLNQMSKWLIVNQQWLATKIQDGIFDVIAAVREFIGLIDYLVQSQGGWQALGDAVKELFKKENYQDGLQMLRDIKAEYKEIVDLVKDLTGGSIGSAAAGGLNTANTWATDAGKWLHDTVIQLYNPRMPAPARDPEHNQFPSAPPEAAPGQGPRSRASRRDWGATPAPAAAGSGPSDQQLQKQADTSAKAQKISFREALNEFGQRWLAPQTAAQKAALAPLTQLDLDSSPKLINTSYRVDLPAPVFPKQRPSRSAPYDDYSLENPDTAPYTPVLDLIGRAEGTGDNYNDTYAHGKYDPANSDGPENMTVEEVEKLQAEMLKRGAPSTAVGRYQIIDTTLKDLMRKMHLSGKELFSRHLQDQMAAALIQLGGGLNRDTLAHIWSSIPNSQGQSDYGQHLGVSPDQVDSALKAAGSVSRAQSIDQRQSSNTTIDRSSQTSINGPITIQTASRDPRAIMTSLRAEVGKRNLAYQANTGLA
jgi:hypothetical protein